MSAFSNPRAALAEAYSLALQLYRSQDLPATMEACRIILDADPLQAETLLLLGVCHLQAGKFEAALGALDVALRARPGWAEAHFNQGLAWQDLGRNEEAVASFQAAVAANPSWAEAFFNLADMLQRLGRLDQALSAYDRVVILQPDYFKALNNKGLVLMDMGFAEPARDSFNAAIACKPDHAKAHNNLGNALLALGNAAEALASYERAIVLDPTLTEAHYNRGNALQELSRFDEAITSYQRAASLHPDYADAHWNEGLCRLLLGDFATGWKKYEWREKLASNRRREVVADGQCPWSGEESLAGLSILLYAEQGLGDTLHFCRYAVLVAALGARVILEVQPALKPLLSGLEGADQVISNGDVLPSFDYSCSLLTLPGLLGTDLASIPNKVPYLAPDADRRSEWAMRLGRKRCMRVGLAWSGSPTHQRDIFRSIPLTVLALLTEIQGIEFVSLQFEVRDTDSAVLARSGIRDFRGEISDFRDTAALATEMDLVISVDTSVAHLAGALGVPVWVLLPRLPDWRWLLEREDSPWYPTARLFRQRATGNWSGVVGEVSSALRAWVARSAGEPG